MAIIRWHKPEFTARNTFDRLFHLRDELDRVFDTPWFETLRSTPFLNGWAPAVDLYENNDAVVVKAELPGMKKEDIELTLHDGVLSIAGERKSEFIAKPGGTQRTERFFGRFQRAISVPSPVVADKIQASYNDGILTVTLPKSEEAKPKQIQVNVD